jgi:hypothetical protein
MPYACSTPVKSPNSRALKPKEDIVYREYSIQTRATLILNKIAAWVPSLGY